MERSEWLALRELGDDHSADPVPLLLPLLLLLLLLEAEAARCSDGAPSVAGEFEPPPAATPDRSLAGRTGPGVVRRLIPG